MIEVREIEYSTPEYEACVRLRLRILREPLGLTLTPEQLAAESTDVHLAAYAKGTLVGCLVLTPHDATTVQMRQVAVDSGMQGRGIGRALVTAAERAAKTREFILMVLHARETAVPFYLTLSYEAEGEIFEEVTLPHRAMFKRL